MKRQIAAAMVLLAPPALAESPVLDLPGFPDFAAVGIGAGPQYIGSGDTIRAAAPLIRKSFDRRYISLEANYLSVNLVDDPHWKAGPAGILRFGRGDVQDAQVAALPDIDMSVDLGGFVAWETGGADPRDRWHIGTGALQDATGAHGGHVMDLNLRRWLPMGRYGAFGLGLAGSWGSASYMDSYFSVTSAGSAASGLTEYSARSGWRDARLTAVFVQPVSEDWAVVGGMIYSYLLDDAANSPVVRRRSQLYAGAGIARSW
ncbi:MipA/OmpV family protein [Pseudooceanicola algae]|uniref:Uncharacterized protein n=1 Tax=Pseudooceanicola algae TaxID=1537215 RepID=A0A418SFQ4_9RHOB|nr:MipA/OmpV family protein [Pseudooceanicola algae]QPM91528.1 hypothetical protein PSAL_027820 [Pseudooceanicola algae]